MRAESSTPASPSMGSPLTDRSDHPCSPQRRDLARPRPSRPAAPPRCAGRAAGGGRRLEPRPAPLRWMGLPTYRPRPARGARRPAAGPRAATWGCSSASATVRTRPQGMPAASSAASHSPTGRVRRSGASMRAQRVVVARRAARWCAKRGSSASVRLARATSQNERHSDSLPTATIDVAVRGLEGLVGGEARMAVAEPARHLAGRAARWTRGRRASAAGSPAARRPRARPRRSLPRRSRASRMPWNAVIPASTSAIDAPTRNGGPSGGPVMLMSPPSPWITAS